VAECLVGAGVRIVHCTPHHIRGSYNTTPDLVREATRELQKELTRAGIPLELRPGMEYLLDEFFPEQLKNPLLLGEENLLLIEAYPDFPVSRLKEYVFATVRAGYRPLLAHPERNPQFAPQHMRKGMLARLHRPPESPNFDLIAELTDLGCLFQGNIGSLTGFYGRRVQESAHSLLERKIYHCFGSDAHSLAQCRATLTRSLSV